MSSTTLDINTSGHFYQKTPSQVELTITAGDAGGVVLGNVIAVKAADSKGYKHDGSEAYAAAIAGIADGTYAQNATINFWRNGQQATLTGLTAGSEYFAKQDGSLDVWANIGASQWTRSMGVAQSTTLLDIEIGPVIQHP